MAHITLTIDATVAACDSWLAKRKERVAQRVAAVIEEGRRPFWRCKVLRMAPLTYEQSEQRLRKQIRNGGACEMLLHPLSIAETTGGYWEGVATTIRTAALAARAVGATHITLTQDDVNLLDGHWHTKTR